MQSQHPFVIGSVYSRRRDIHEPFAGQRQGGVSTPTSVPLIFLFTGDSGAAFGYEDGFRPDGTYWYTGEGQIGNMAMVRGNAAILRHRELRKQLLLFESSQRGYVCYLGEAEYLEHHLEQRPDGQGNYREAIIFHLGILPDPSVSNATSANHPRLTRRLSELRESALKGVPSDAAFQERRSNVARRAQAVKDYAMVRSKGICEGCHAEAPFRTRNGPFLEVHHVFRLGDGGPDHPENVIALCPNCHRRAHHSSDAKAFNHSLINWLRSTESAD